MIREATALTLMIDNRQDTIDIKEINGIIEKVVTKTIEHEGIKNKFEISIILVDNTQIQSINKEYRKIDSPTDVLSFPMIEYDKPGTIPHDEACLEVDYDTGDILLGDIAISLEKAYEQSKEYGHSFEREVAFLTLHGMLHLLGYDHIEENDRALMRQKEEEILNILKINR